MNLGRSAFLSRADVDQMFADGPSVDDMFRAGMDTREIARRTWRREADVLRELTVQRAARLKKPAVFER